MLYDLLRTRLLRSRMVRALARRLLAGPAQAPGPLPHPAPAHGTALEALGAERLPTPIHLHGGHAAMHATLPPAPPETALIAVAVTAQITVGPARLRLGTEPHDTLDLPPRDTPWHAWLFVPPHAAPNLALEALATRTRMRLLEAAAWSLPPAALDPARLIPRQTLAPDADWPRAYGPAPAENPLARLREQVFSRLAHPVLVPFLDGLHLWLEPGDELSRALFLSGTYEPDTLLAVQTLLPQGGTFVDIGANCGLISAFAARRAARVLAFEPSPREFARLQANLAANASHATATRAAIAETTGTVTLRLAEPGHAGHNTIGTAFAYHDVATAALEQVPATTLDIALADLPRCDLIKMDIEGAELAALRGGATALSRLRPTLILEVFDRALAGCGATELALFAWLDTNGYNARDLDPATARFDTPARPHPGISRNIIALPR